MQNAELGRKVVDVMDTAPELFDMGTWGSHTPCGTVGCLAGHAMLQAGYSLSFGGLFTRPDGSAVLDEAAEAQYLLGMSRREVSDPETEAGCDCCVKEPTIWMDFKNGPDRFRKLVEESEGKI
jgi:hypothetical protein